jgi:sulfur-carrier protein adenylyltransferase/sulfurtransferase
LLANRGMDVTSMNGGIDAWNGLVARTKVDQGMVLIEGNETAEEVIALAYGLEEGSRRFYQDLGERSERPEVKRLFETLREAEVRHEDRLWERYRSLPDHVDERQAFEDRIVVRALEGGVTPDPFLARYPEAAREPAEALDLAMALETDALDLYLRMAAAFDQPEVRSVFFDLAEEERDHLKRLGNLRGREP